MIENDLKKDADQWVFLGFSILFLIIQIILFAWFIAARRSVRQLKRDEKGFLENFIDHKKKARVDCHYYNRAILKRTNTFLSDQQH